MKNFLRGLLVAICCSLGASTALAEDLILILPGLGGNEDGERAMEAWGEQLADQGYTVVVSDYASRESVEDCVKGLDRSIRELNIESYDEVHVFAYILGSWTLNLWLHDNTLPNLASIVYDRSPLQERAPAVGDDLGGPLVRLWMGAVVEDLANTPYPTLSPLEGVAMGLLIENRATALIRRFKDRALAMGPLSWDHRDLGQPADDYMYTPVNHDQMYSYFHHFGPELVHFFEQGRFSEGARRQPMEGDPFSVWEE